MIEGIGNTKIIEKDPTKAHLKKIQEVLRDIKKEVNIPNKSYYQSYPSDAIPPRAYGQCKAHKPSKNYPFRILVSTIRTAAYKLNKYSQSHSTNTSKKQDVPKKLQAVC